MLDIVASYHCMQIQGELINQLEKKQKKNPSFRPQIFFHGFYLYQTFDIVASYHYVQFQGKLIN